MIAKLASAQQPNGSFPSFSSSDPLDFSAAIRHQSIFPTALILNCLCSLPATRPLTRIKRSAADYLLGQKSPHWSFNYWDRQAPETTTLPYPDDLDDTFVSLAALYRCQPSLINGQALASIASLLTTLEVAEGGPYKTWLVPPTAAAIWQDVDLAVNNNIAAYLSLQDVTLDSLTHLAETAIRRKNFTSPYYPSPYPVIYYLSRWYRGPLTSALITYLLVRQLHAIWENPLYTALASTSLINLGHSAGLSEAGNYLRSSIYHLESYAFCMDPAINRQPYYMGSPALTLAFTLEALHLLSHSPSKISHLASSISTAHAVVRLAKKRFSTLPPDLQQVARIHLRKLVKSDLGQQIILLPYWFAASLRTPSPQLAPAFLNQLSLANLYGWIAYTIYDNFLDDEGKPQDLSLANLCLRELTAIFTHLPAMQAGALQAGISPEFTSFFHTTMDQLDAANTWEVTHHRSDDYQQLAAKSLGHALGPAAILCTTGSPPGSPLFNHVWAFFTHYLIARQLNDDAHDWEADLSRGHLNAVGAAILQHSNPQSLSHQQLFWSSIIQPTCRTIQTHCRQARQHLHQVKRELKPDLLLQLLAAAERAAKQALTERRHALQFIRRYGMMPPH